MKKKVDKKAKMRLFAMQKEKRFVLFPLNLSGGVAERSNATDCKSVDLVYDGSNPSPSTI